MKHLMTCPRSLLGADDKPCTCGAGITVVAPTPQDLAHTDRCPARALAVSDDECTCGAVQGASAPPTGESPYADIEYARSLVKRAESLATESPDLARFLLQIATEARLLAELQGRWEYAS